MANPTGLINRAWALEDMREFVGRQTSEPTQGAVSRLRLANLGLAQNRQLGQRLSRGDARRIDIRQKIGIAGQGLGACDLLGQSRCQTSSAFIFRTGLERIKIVGHGQNLCLRRPGSALNHDKVGSP